MEIRQNPFSLYDFLGYFIPGALFIIGISVVSPEKLTIPVDISKISISLPLNDASFYLPFILGSYFLGHILSYISSITIENYANWHVGYPSKYLLGHIKASYFSEKDEYPKTRKFLRIIVWLFLFPITFLDITIGILLNLKQLLYGRKLDDPILISVINKKLYALLKLTTGNKKGTTELNSGIFRIAYHHAVEHANQHFSKLQNYVALYGFTRTVTMVIVLLFWYLIILMVNNMELSFLVPLFILSFLSFFSYLNFMKFYRRFSLEVFMALVTTIPNK